MQRPITLPSSGRSDFQNGDPRAQYESLFGRLLRLPDETLVFPAHDYKGDTVGTIGEEKAFNPRLQVKSVDESVALMNSLNLSSPKMMDVAVPANMRQGLHQEEVARRGWAFSAQQALALVGQPDLVPIDLREKTERERSVNVGRQRGGLGRVETGGPFHIPAGPRLRRPAPCSRRTAWGLKQSPRRAKWRDTMVRRHLIYVDMTPGGELRRSPGLTLGMRIAIAAALVAVAVGGLALGALVLGLALTLLPIAFVAIMIAYAAFRLELWRTGRLIRRQRHVFRR